MTSNDIVVYGVHLGLQRIAVEDALDWETVARLPVHGVAGPTQAQAQDVVDALAAAKGGAA